MKTPILLGTLVVGLLLAAAPPASAVAGTASGTRTTWVRAELVDRHGRPSGQFIDSRGETRTLMVNLDSRFHYLRHLGVDNPNTGLDITYVDATSGLEVHRESLTTRRSGAFASTPLDLRTLLTPGAPVTVGVHHASGEPTILQDLIEYALLPAIVP